MRKFTIYNLQFTIIALICTLYIVHFTFPTPVYAATPCPTTSSPTGIPIGNSFGFGNICSLGDAITKLVGPAFSISAAAVVIYFLLGAFKYLMSGGKKEEIEGARNMIFHAIIGFILLMFAFLILQFLLSSLFNIRGFGIIG